MPEPDVATISQVPELPGGLQNSSDFFAFIEAVRNGKVAEFVKSHNLSGHQIAELYSYLRTKVRFDTNEGSAPPNPLNPGVYGNVASGLLDFLGGATSDLTEALNWDVPGQGEDVDNPEFTSERLTDAMDALRQEAQSKGVEIATSDMAVNDYVNRLAEKKGIRPGSIAEVLMELNPDFPTEGNLSAGTPIATGIGTYKWKIGDTAQTVERALGLPAGALTAWWAKLGIDPDAFAFGEDVPIPTAYEPPAAEMRGEGTVPQATGAPMATPGTTGTTGEPGPGGYPLGYEPKGTGESQDDILAELSAQALISMLLPEDTTSYQKTKARERAPDLERYAKLFKVAAGDVGTSREDYFRQFASEGAPSTDSVMDALRSLGAQGEYTPAASEYLGDQRGVIETVMAVLGDRMGPYMAPTFLGDDFIAAVEEKLGQARLAGEDKDIIDILVEIGYL